jgi:hypothetical protein
MSIKIMVENRLDFSITLLTNHQLSLYFILYLVKRILTLAVGINSLRAFLTITNASQIPLSGDSFLGLLVAPSFSFFGGLSG